MKTYKIDDLPTLSLSAFAKALIGPTTKYVAPDDVAIGRITFCMQCERKHAMLDLTNDSRVDIRFPMATSDTDSTSTIEFTDFEKSISVSLNPEFVDYETELDAPLGAPWLTLEHLSDDLGVPQHVLRFWETRFTQIKPMKRSGGRRYYSMENVTIIRVIHRLIYTDGYTIRGVQRILDGS